MSFGFSLWRMNFIVSFPACLPHPYDRRTGSFMIEFVHTGSSIFTRSLYSQKISIVSQWMCFSVGYTVIEFVLGYMQT